MQTRRALRRQFLDMVARRQRPGAGSLLSALDARRIRMDWWNEVEHALRNVPHAIAGGVASNAYAPERLTEDIAVVVLATVAPQAHRALQTAGWRLVGSLTLAGGTSWKDAAGHDLVLIALSEPWAEEALNAAQENRIVDMPALPLPYLVFMKLQAGRTIDLADVSRVLGRAEAAQVEEARRVVRRFGNTDDLADFEQLVRMGQLEREQGRTDEEGGLRSEGSVRQERLL